MTYTANALFVKSHTLYVVSFQVDNQIPQHTPSSFFPTTQIFAFFMNYSESSKISKNYQVITQLSSDCILPEEKIIDGNVGHREFVWKANARFPIAVHPTESVRLVRGTIGLLVSVI